MAKTSSHARPGDAVKASEALIGRTTRVRGRVTGEGDLVVEGRVEGDIAIRGDLTLAEGSEAVSNVEADSVTIAGALEGDVSARGLVRVAAGSRVRGNMAGESVAIDEGAEFAGRLDADFELPPQLSQPSGSTQKAQRR